MADETRADKWRLIRGTDLKSEDRFCLLTLFLIQGDNDSAFCKQETLADEIGIHPRSVRRSLNRLNSAGIIRSDWQLRNNVPMRHYAIDFEKLKTVQRGDGRTSASYPERVNGRTSASATVGHQRPNHQDTSVLQDISIENPMNIQGKSALGNSPNSLASSRRKSKANSDDKLTAFCAEWNNWHSAGIVRQKIRDTDSPGKTIVDAWNRSQRDPEQRERLKDLPGLRAAIESSQQMLKPAAWFDAAGLIGGKNSNRRWYAEQLVAGIYGKSQLPANCPEAETAWQNVLNSLGRHSHYYPEKIMGDIGERPWQAMRPIGLKRLEEANDFDRRELKTKFIQEYSKLKAQA